VRSDIYSFGILLFRWLTGELPFDTGPVLRLFAHHLESKAPPPSWLLEEIHPGLDRLILAAMRKNPANRYPSMTEVLADLECVVSGQGKVRGAPLLHECDEYTPRTEQAKRACAVLERSGMTGRASPVQSGVRTSENPAAASEKAMPAGKAVLAEA
jgi:serine/threonine protein kinase